MSFWQRMARRSNESINDGFDGTFVPAPHQEETAVALMEKPTTPELPIPQPVKAEPSAHADVLDEYEQLAQSIGFKPTAVRTERLRTTLAEMGLSIYERAKVEAYLTSKFGAEKATAVGRSATWTWRPMRSADILESITSFRDDSSSGGIVFLGEARHLSASGPMLMTNGTIQQYGPCYDKAMPMPVLHTVKRVLEQIPTARFFVSDETTLAERFRDPFLAVMLPGGDDLYVIERWDEPGFRG